MGHSLPAEWKFLLENTCGEYQKRGGKSFHDAVREARNELPSYNIIGLGQDPFGVSKGRDTRRTGRHRSPCLYFSERGFLGKRVAVDTTQSLGTAKETCGWNARRKLMERWLCQELRYRTEFRVEIRTKVDSRRQKCMVREELKGGALCSVLLMYLEYFFNYRLTNRLKRHKARNFLDKFK